MTPPRVDRMSPQEARTFRAKGELVKLADLLTHKGHKYDRDWMTNAGPERMMAQIVIKAMRAEACTTPKDACDELDDIASYAMLVKSMLMEMDK